MTGQIFAGAEGTSEVRLYGEDVKEIVRAFHGADGCGTGVGLQIGGAGEVAGEGSEGGIVPAPVEVLSPGGRLAVALRRGGPEHDDGVRMTKRERADNGRVEHAEYGGGDADSQGQRGDGDKREGRRAAKLAYGEMQVLNQSGEHGFHLGFLRWGWDGSEPPGFLVQLIGAKGLHGLQLSGSR